MRLAAAIYMFILCGFFSLLNAQWYTWPLYPVMKRYCRGTFCEYRSGHFHEGIDIPASGVFTVYATTDTFKYIGYAWNPQVGYIVAVQHYSQLNNTQRPLEEGSRYIHMNTVNSLYEDSIYIGQPIAEDITFYDNHLHFEMRRPAPVGVSGAMGDQIFTLHNCRSIVGEMFIGLVLLLSEQKILVKCEALTPIRVCSRSRTLSYANPHKSGFFWKKPHGQ